MTKFEMLAEAIGKINRDELTPREMKKIIHSYNADLNLLEHLQGYIDGIMKTIKAVRK